MLITVDPPEGTRLRHRWQSAVADCGPISWWPRIHPAVTTLLEVGSAAAGAAVGVSSGAAVATAGAAIGAAAPAIVIAMASAAITTGRQLRALIRGGRSRTACPIRVAESVEVGTTPPPNMHELSGDEFADDLVGPWDGWQSRRVCLVVENRSPYLLHDVRTSVEQRYALNQVVGLEQVDNLLRTSSGALIALPPWARATAHLYTEFLQTSEAFHGPFGNQLVEIGRSVVGAHPPAVLTVHARGVPSVQLTLSPPILRRHAPET